MLLPDLLRRKIQTRINLYYKIPPLTISEKVRRVLVERDTDQNDRDFVFSHGLGRQRKSSQGLQAIAYISSL